MSEDNNQQPPIYNQSVHIEGDMHGDVIVHINAAEKAAPPARPVLKTDPDRCADYWRGIASAQESRANRNRDIGIRAAGLAFVGGALTALWLCCNACDRTQGIEGPVVLPPAYPPLSVDPLLPSLPPYDFGTDDFQGFLDEHYIPGGGGMLDTVPPLLKQNQNECVFGVDFGAMDFPLFDEGSALLTPAQETCLRELAVEASSEYLLGNLNALVIGGYATPLGFRQDNKDLSLERAHAVQQFLETELFNLGADGMGLVLAPHGETRLIGEYSDDVIHNDAEPPADEIDPRDRRFTIDRIDPPEHDDSGFYRDLNPQI